MSQRLLTSLELKVMNCLWDLDKAFVKDIIEVWKEEPKPAYNTISTIVRILEEKGFVKHENVGRSHLYSPKIPRSKYRNSSVQSLLDNVFGGSLTNLVSTIVEDKELSDEELKRIQEMIEKRMNK